MIAAHETDLNYGQLKDSLPAEFNIVYHRRGAEELSLNITNACPNRCTFCIRDRDAGWGVSNLYLAKDPSVEEIVNAFDASNQKIKGAGTALEKVKICGYGEPILRFNDLFPIVQHIRRYEPTTLVQLTTTGWPYFKFVSADTSRLKNLKESGLTDVYLSLTTTKKDEYDKIVKPVKCNTAFDDSIRFAKAAKDAGIHVTVGFMKIGGLREEEVKDFCDKLNLEYRLREFEP